MLKRVRAEVMARVRVRLVIGLNLGFGLWIRVSMEQYSLLSLGTGIRGLIRGMATLPQGNQELLVVRDKVGRPSGELGVSKSIECDIFPSVL